MAKQGWEGCCPARALRAGRCLRRWSWYLQRISSASAIASRVLRRTTPQIDTHPNLTEGSSSAVAVAIVVSSILTRTLRLTKPCDITVLQGLWQGTRLTKHFVTSCKRHPASAGARESTPSLYNPATLPLVIAVLVSARGSPRKILGAALKLGRRLIARDSSATSGACHTAVVEEEQGAWPLKWMTRSFVDLTHSFLDFFHLVLFVPTGFSRSNAANRTSRQTGGANLRITWYTV